MWDKGVLKLISLLIKFRTRFTFASGSIIVEQISQVAAACVLTASVGHSDSTLLSEDE